MIEQQSFFKDLLVVELSSVLAGPAVGMFFAELGARVIKVENKSTGGDVTRAWKLPAEDQDQTYSAYYHSINWGKETHLLDLSDEQDRKRILEWIRRADVVITNFKAGSDKKLGMDYERLRALNPRLIYAAVSAYGPDNSNPGFDAMIQAETGWVFMNGEPDGPPVKLPVALMDILAGHQLKEGVLVALLQRRRTGKGCRVDVSLFDTGVGALTNQASNWLNAGILPRRKGSQHPNIAPYGDIFYTKDDRAVIMGTGTQRQFERLCSVLQLPQLKDEPVFQTNLQRVRNRPELIQRLKPAFKALTLEQLLRACREQGVTLAPVNNLEEVFRMPAAQALILEETLPDGTISKRVKTVVFKIGE